MNPPPTAAVHAEPMGALYWLGRTFFRIWFTTYFRWRHFNAERVPRTGPVILASNHASFLDPPLVGAPLRRPVYFLARDTLFRFPPAGALLRSWNTVPVDREGGGAAGLRKILEVLSHGHAIVIFPEGTRSTDGQLQRARSGLGLIVLKSEAPVVPVRVFGTFEAYGRNARLPRPHPIAVKYGKPLQFDQLRREAGQCGKARLKEIYQEISDQVLEAIRRLPSYEEKERFPG